LARDHVAARWRDALIVLAGTALDLVLAVRLLGTATRAFANSLGPAGTQACA
jgi:hypothetical protein